MINSNANHTAEKTTLSLGLIFACITLTIDGFQTIVNKIKPSDIDSLFFAWITACIELGILLPFFLRSHKNKAKSIPKHDQPPKMDPLQLRIAIFKIICAGIIFAFCAYYLILGFTLVDSVTGILAVKTQPLSGMLIGFILLKEKLSWKEILIGLMMLVLIVYITTKGTFQITDITIGVVILLIVPVFWNLGHSIAKPFIKQNYITVVEFVFIRIGITALILGIIFAVKGDWSDFRFFLLPNALASILGMSFIFACSHNTWYQTIKRLPLSLASLIVIPSPIITAVLAFLITHEPLYGYHFIGITGEILGLYALILLQHNQNKNK